MRIAATDYDGTLCQGGKVSKEVLAAVDKWRSAGNRFGIVTGRDRDMIVYEIERWNIPFDFLVCCNGAALYDQNLRVLEYTCLQDGLAPRILTHASAEAGLHYELCREEGTYLHVLHKDSWFSKLGVPYREVDFEAALSLSSLQQIGLAYHTSSEAGKHAEVLDAAFGMDVRVYQNGVCIDITDITVSKANGLQTLLQRLGWPETGLLVIGDGENDLPMLRRYKGCTVARAVPAVQREAEAVYEDVGEMLTAHMGQHMG